MGLCHHGIALPRIQDERGLHTLRAAPNTLSKQPWATEKGWSSS